MNKGTLKLHQAMLADFHAAQKHGVSAERIAVACDRSAGWAYQVMNGEINPSFEHVMAWAEETGGEHITRFIAQRMGFLAVPMQDGVMDAAEMGETISRFGALVQTYAAAGADFTITTDELSQIEDEYARLTIALAALIEDARENNRRAGRARSLKEAF